MQAVRVSGVETFLARAGAFLEAREAEHNLLLGISSRLRTNPRLYGEEPFFAVVEEGDRIVMVAMRTPPHLLLVSETDYVAGCRVLAPEVAAAFGELPGALGPGTGVEAFAELGGADRRRGPPIPGRAHLPGRGRHLAHRGRGSDAAVRAGRSEDRLRGSRRSPPKPF